MTTKHGNHDPLDGGLKYLVLIAIGRQKMRPSADGGDTNAIYCRALCL